jgi:hypothetical protein
MANRVLLGNRATGGYGLYVSQSGENVLDTTNALQFDSRMGASVIIHSYGQGSIAGGASAHTITHSLGYNPLFAVRWSESITSGLATKTYTVAYQNMTYIEYEEEEESASGEGVWGCSVAHASTNAITITNDSDAQGASQNATLRTLYYAYVIFHEADFTGGKGL